MRRILYISLTFLLYLACTKSIQNSSTTTPPTTVPPADSLNSWVRGGSVPGSSDLQDIWFIDNQNGLIAGESQLFSSSDGGLNWTVIPNTVSFSMINLQFLDNLYGFAQGGKQLGKTYDGGKSWSLSQLPTGNVLSFQFISPSTGFYNDIMTGLYKTIDSGNTWLLIANGSNGQQTLPFYFLDSLNGFVMINGNFSKTIDGGAHWQLIASNVATSNISGFFKMQFLDTLNGFCATPKGLLKTIDGGISWTNSLNTTANLVVPHFFDSKNGYCLENNYIQKTTDGGATWQVNCKMGADSFSGFHFLDMNNGWACTFGGKVLILKV